MSHRLEQLRNWSLSSTLVGLAEGILPHTAFEAICQPLHFDKRRREAGLNLDRIEVREETDGQPSAALWEHDYCDGHAFEVLYCARQQNELRFWKVIYDNTAEIESGQIARSEQGLFYWLFFSLIQSEFSRHGERAYSTLVQAAKSVDFKYLVDVFRLEEEIGSDFERRGELVAQSLAIV